MKLIWINGLAGAGKTSTARLLCARLKECGSELGCPAVLNIDGDEFRSIFGHKNYDKQSRINGTITQARLCCSLARQGVWVVNTAISLFKECYKDTRQIAKDYGVEFIEIHIRCDFAELEKRDQKGLYSGAKCGGVRDVVGIDIAYDDPKPDLLLDGTCDLEENVEKIIQHLTSKYIF